MDIDRLIEFQKIVESGSFKDASSALGIAPSVLSTRFKAFEGSLNMTLINRSSHSFELTAAGRILFERSDDLIRSYNNIFAGMSSISDTAFSSLRLQLCAQSMPVELGPYLDLYCREHPHLFLGLYDENTCHIQEGILSGEIDVSFAVGRDNDFKEIPGRIVIGSFPHLRVHVPGDHRLSSKDSICFKDLSAETFILYPKMKESFTRDLQKSFLDQSGIDYAIYDESHSPFFYDLLVPIGKGVSLWSWNFRSAPNTALLNIRDSGYETFMYMLYDPGSSNPTVDHFINGFIEFRGGRS